MPHNIGDKLWFRGDLVTVTGKPYTLYGGNWQDATTESGLTVTVPTPGDIAENRQRNAKERISQQDDFRRLRDIMKDIP